MGGTDPHPLLLDKDLRQCPHISYIILAQTSGGWSKILDN